MSWNVMDGELWYAPATWNWDPQCQAPLLESVIGNATNSTNLTTVATEIGCTDYCGFNYPLYWPIEDIRVLVYPIFLYIIGVLYTFVAIAIICDEFFVPALERICEKYSISHDVAGATLMAAGGSAPELATSFVGTFSDSPVGFGTIVGSAVFNVLFVIGACAFASPDTLKLDWWPLFRDASYYSFSLLIVAIFFGYSSPSRIYWYEAVILFLLYIVYVVIMSQNRKLEHLVLHLISKCRHPIPSAPDSAVYPEGSMEKSSEVAVHPEGSMEKSSEVAVHPQPPDKKKDDNADLEVEKMPKKDDDMHPDQKKDDNADLEVEKDTNKDAVDGDDGDDDDDEGPMEIIWPTAELFEDHKKCACCKLCAARVMFIIALPLNALFYVTVPDVRREDSQLCGRTVHWNDLWLPGFLISILWIGVFSYLMVWWAEILGKVSTVPSPIVGLTLLAAGTSIPDLVSSVVVARKGEGNMAVSSSIGSNIFDILVGLPIPWLSYSIYHGVQKWGDCTEDGDNHFCFSLRVYADTLLFSVLLLILMVIIVISIVHCSGWRMTKGLGISMLILYFLFVAQDILRNCNLVEPVARWFTWLRSNG